MSKSVLYSSVTGFLMVCCVGCYDYEIPAETQIACSADDRSCPSGFECKISVGRCLPSTEGDVTPPTASALVVTPLRVKAGATVQLVFTVDEALSADPKLTLWVGGDAVVALSEADQVVAGEYTYHYQASGDECGCEGAGRCECAADVQIDMQDKAANRSTLDQQRIFTFDFTAPGVVLTDVNPAVAAAGSQLLYSIVADEELAGDAPQAMRAVRQGGSETLDFVLRPGTHYIYSYPVESGAQLDGTYLVGIDLEDRAGNQALDLSSDVDGLAFAPIVIDTTPVQISQVHLSREVYSLLAEERRVELTFDCDENLDAQSQLRVTVGAQPMVCSGTGNGPVHYSCEYTLQASDTHGEKSVIIATQDSAGNAATHSETVVFDLQGPRLVGSSLQREPAFGPSIDGSTTYFSQSAPMTQQQVYASVLLYADEALDPTAVEIAANELSTDLAVVWQSVSGQTAHLRFTPPEPGNYTFTVRWSDLHGNGSSALLSEDMVVAATPPDSASLDMERVEYQRAPWGSSQSPDMPHFSILGAAGSADALQVVRVIAFRANDASPGFQIGFTNIDAATGAFEISGLAGGDIPRVYLAAVNRAGLVGAPLLVERVELVAALGVAEDNPHRLIETGRFPQASLGNYTEVQDITALGQNNGVTHQTAAHMAWPMNFSRQAYPTISFPRGVFDSTRGVIVSFGGNLQEGWSDQTWEWDGASWHLACGTGAACLSPGALSRQGIAYDSAQERTIVMGGFGGTDTWAWDGQTWETLCHNWQYAPRGHRMVYDQSRNRVVSFGGVEGNTLVPGTWEFDGQQWHQVCSSDDGCPSPAPRKGHGMVYDPKRKLVLTYGGDLDTEWHQTEHLLADLRAWDGQNWQLLCDTQVDCTGPTARAGFSMALDYHRDRLVVYGGFTGMQLSDETWEWDGAQWQLVCGGSTSCQGPPDRMNADMVYDAIRQRVILFGGNDHGDTWSWDGTAWTRLLNDSEQAKAPIGREQQAMVYNKATGTVLMAGGWRYASWPVDAWQWNGQRWIELCSGTTSCNTQERQYQTMVYSDSTGALSLGSKNDDLTLQWQGNAWDPICGGTTSCSGPSQRYATAMAYDVVRDTVTLFGGKSGGNLNDTWEWALWGTPTCLTDTEPCWREITVSGDKPPRRGFHTMTYDENSGLILLANGNQEVGLPLEDLWSWDGSVWTQLCGAPTECSGLAVDTGSLYYDPDRQRTALYDPLQGELWEWTGAAWSKLCGASGCIVPKGLSGAPAVFDADRHQVVVFGGSDVIGVFDTTWIWDTQRGSLPAQVLRVGLTSGSEPDLDPQLCRDEDSCNVESISVKWYAGGVTSTSGTTLHGALLGAWNNQSHQWEPLDASGGVVSNQSPVSAPTELSWSTDQSAHMAQFFSGPDQELRFFVAPLEESAAYGASQIVSDHVEVRIRYTVPVTACGEVTFQGQCDGDTVVWCNGDDLRRDDCTNPDNSFGVGGASFTCGLLDCAQPECEGYFCVPELGASCLQNRCDISLGCRGGVCAVSDSCDADYRNSCLGNVLTYCSRETKVYDSNCADLDGSQLTCAVDSTGEARCLEVKAGECNLDGDPPIGCPQGLACTGGTFNPTCQ